MKTTRRAFADIARCALLAAAALQPACVRTHTFDRPLDGATDEGVDVGSDDVIRTDANDAPPPDAGTVPAMAVLIAPMSGARVSGRIPSVTVEPHSPITAAVEVQACADPACVTVIATASGPVGAGATRVRLALDIPPDSNNPGALFWRARDVSATGAASAYTDPWVMYRTHVAASRSAIVGLVLDMDRDGHPDFAGGATGNAATSVPGSLRIHRASPAGSGIEQVAVAVINAPTGRVLFAEPLVNAGDINGDGFSDLLVIASLPGGTPATKEVYTVRGSADLSRAALSPIVTSSTTAGYAAHASALGDVNGDGYGDVGISTLGASTSLCAYYVYFGSASGLTASPTRLVDPNAAIDSSVRDGFGNSSLMLGDVDDDGFGDFAIFAPVGMPRTAWFVYHGAAAFRGTTTDPTVVTTTLAGFGAAVDAGDLNGDGLLDLAVGSSVPSVQPILQSPAHTFAGVTPIPLLAIAEGIAVLEDESGTTQAHIVAANSIRSSPTVGLYPCTSSACAASAAIVVGSPTMPIGYSSAPFFGMPPLAGYTTDAILASTSADASMHGRVVLVTPPDTSIPAMQIFTGTVSGDGFGRNLSANH